MGTYGRNLEFRIPPMSENRAGRFATKTTDTIPLGAPVKVDITAAQTTLGLQPVVLATGAQAPIGGLTGLLVFEYGPAAFAGFDPYLTTYSDLGTAPPGRAVQVISGPYVKVVFTNTVTEVFLGNRSYTGRTMVSGLGATPTLDVGDYLTPGTGNDTDGYWDGTDTAADAWLVVTSVDPVRNEIEARFVY